MGVKQTQKENEKMKIDGRSRVRLRAAHLHEDSAPKRVFTLRVTTTLQSLPK